MAIASYRDLDVFQRSMAALVAVHRLVQKFPDFERYVLTDQMRRASKSIPTNVAEGYGRRKSVKEFRRFLDIALGSANEMVVHLEIAQALGYASLEECTHLIDDYTVIAKMLYKLNENWQTYPASRSHESAFPPGI